MESQREKRKRDFKEKLRVASLKREENDRLRRLSKILNKNPEDRTYEEQLLLNESKSFISVVESRIVKQNKLKQRDEEIEDELSVLDEKIEKLFDLIIRSEHVVVFTGAGISTSSNIPDYRGPKGVWTQLTKNGSIPKTQDLALAIPSFTHMALKQMVDANIIKHIISQNCDGLHLRSGLPIDRLSEIHGNMYVEVCQNCFKTVYRDFDVTALTGLRQHGTGRFCEDCVHLKDVKSELIDTIVHFGEKGKLESPLNWKGAVESVNKCDLILCLGSSLKVLKNYPCLWPKKNDKKKKVNIAICNLQWTPKDKVASIKLNAKCDFVMEKLAKKLGLEVEQYDLNKDKLRNLYTPLSDEEQVNCNRYQLFTDKHKLEIKQETINSASNAIIPGWFGKGFRKIK